MDKKAKKGERGSRKRRKEREGEKKERGGRRKLTTGNTCGGKKIIGAHPPYIY
jgi:hypothetical protein